jgi:hypothetical protein
LRAIEVLVEAGDHVRKGRSRRLSTELAAEALRAAALGGQADKSAAALRRGEAVVAAGRCPPPSSIGCGCEAAAAWSRPPAAEPARRACGWASSYLRDDGIITSRQAAAGQVVQVSTELLRFCGAALNDAGIPESGRACSRGNAVIVTPAGAHSPDRAAGPGERADRMAIAYVDLRPIRAHDGMFARGRRRPVTGRLVPAAAVVNQTATATYSCGPEQRVARRQVETATVGTASRSCPA